MFILFCRGNRVAHFEARELAEAYVEANATEDAPAEVWELQDTAASEPAESVIEGPTTPRDGSKLAAPHDEVEVTYTPPKAPHGKKTHR